MESHDYPIEHFKMMVELSARLKSIPALILEHSYSYETFGSWWFAFERSGRRFRVIFDGRDEYLSLEWVAIADDAKVVAEWQSLDGKPLPDVSSDSLISEVCALVSSQ
jgi:hypothetical protein